MYPTSPKPDKIISLSNKIKEWGYFKVGSYWIMRDSVTGFLDSVYVQSVSTSFHKYYTLSDSNILAEETTINFGFNANMPLFLGQLKLASYPYDYISEQVYCTEYSIFIIDSTKIGGNGSGIILNKEAGNYQVLSNDYANVRLINESFKFACHSGPQVWIRESYYWVKKIGMIKKRRTVESLQVYELLRYKIYQ